MLTVEIGHKTIAHTQTHTHTYIQKLARAHAYKNDHQIEKEKNNVPTTVLNNGREKGKNELIEKQQIAYKILGPDENTK